MKDTTTRGLWSYEIVYITIGELVCHDFVDCALIFLVNGVVNLAYMWNSLPIAQKLSLNVVGVLQRLLYHALEFQSIIMGMNNDPQQSLGWTTSDQFPNDK